MADHLIARAIENIAGLRVADGDDPNSLAIYSNRSGTDAFIIEREDIRLLPDRRFIPNRGIDRLRLHPQAKESATHRKLLVTLANGEQLELPVDGEDGRFLEIFFPLYAFLRRRIHQQRRAKPAAST